MSLNQIASAVALLLVGLQSAQAQTLWTLQPSRSVSLHSPGAVRSVVIATELGQMHAQATRLDLQMPDGSVLVSELERSEQRGAERLSWFGKIAGEPDSTVVLTREGPYLAGYISSAAGIFEISPSVSGTVLMQHDSARFPECGGHPEPPVEHAAQETTVRAADTVAPNDEPNQIDALIVVSPASLSALGGQAQAQTFAQSAVDLSNQSYANSNMIARLRLAGVRFTTRADSGDSGTDLTWLRNDAEVAGWRIDTRADMVSMISEFSDSCGRGYLMTSASSGFASSAFQVSSRGCAVGNLTYPHEHGHNMGFAHNPESGGSAVAPYAYGHWHSGQYRTIMSYADPCSGGCTRRPYFSNPDINFNGLPTGIAEQRDNARAGDMTAPIIANFRDDLELPQTILRNGFE